MTGQWLDGSMAVGVLLLRVPGEVGAYSRRGEDSGNLLSNIEYG